MTRILSHLDMNPNREAIQEADENFDQPIHQLILEGTLTFSSKKNNRARAYRSLSEKKMGGERRRKAEQRRMENVERRVGAGVGWEERAESAEEA